MHTKTTKRDITMQTVDVFCKKKKKIIFFIGLLICFGYVFVVVLFLYSFYLFFFRGKGGVASLSLV